MTMNTPYDPGVENLKKRNELLHPSRFHLQLIFHLVVLILLGLMLWKISKTYLHFLFWFIITIPSEIALFKILQLFYSKLSYRLFFFLSRFQKLHKFLLFEIQYQSKNPIIHYLDTRAFHLIFRLPWEELRIILHILYQNFTYSYAVCPKGKQIIEECTNHNYSVKSMKKLTSFYEISNLKLIQDMIQGKSISDEQIERVIYESTGDTLNYLKQNLSPNNPILVKIQNLAKLKTEQGYSILK